MWIHIYRENLVSVVWYRSAAESQNKQQSHNIHLSTTNEAMGRMALEPNPKYDNLWYLKDKICHLNLTPGKPAKIWISGHICLHKQQAVQMLLENSHNLHLTMFVGTLTAFFGESTTASKNGMKINNYHWVETQKSIFCDSKPSKEQQFFLKRTSFLSTHPFLNPHFVLSSTILPGTWNISHVFIKGKGFFFVTSA